MTRRGPGRSRGDRRAVRTLIACAALNHAAFAGSRVVVSLAALQLSASPFAIGLILSFYSLLPMFLSVAGGRWIDRVGMRLPMLGGTALLAFGVAVPALAWDVAGLFLAAVTMGLGFMAQHLCTQKAVGELGGERGRVTNFALLSLGFSISGFTGPTGAGLLIDLVGHRATFVLLALAPVLAALGLWSFWRRRRRATLGPVRRAETAAGRAPGGSAGTGADPGPLTAPGGSVLDLMREPELKRLYVAVAMLSSAWDVHQFLVPLYGAKLGLSASLIGLVLGSFAAATFIVRLALPLLARKVSEWPLIMFAMAVATGVYAVYPFFPTLAPMLVLSFVLGLGLGVAQPMVLSQLHRVSPAGRIGEAAGLRLTLVNATQTFLPTAFGAVGGVLGLAPMFWGMAALIAAGAAYARRSGGQGRQGGAGGDLRDDGSGPL